MLKFRPKDDRVQAIRVHRDAPEGQRTIVIGSFPSGSEKIPRRILDKMTDNDLRELIGKVPLSTWYKGVAVDIKPADTRTAPAPAAETPPVKEARSSVADKQRSAATAPKPKR